MSAMTSESDTAPPPGRSKVDPETLALRGHPRRVVRFRRGLLIGVAAAGSASIIAVTWLALQPAGLKLAAQQEDTYGTDRKATPEGLAQLPASYGEIQDVPKLGPPLPGDLGRPILAHQREQAEMSQADSLPDELAQSAAAGRQQAAAESRAAREAGVFALTAGLSSPSGSASRSGGVGPEPTDGPQVTSAAQATAPSGEPRLRSALSPWQIDAGTIIPASLLTGVDSDLAGLVIAQVTENVGDSATGRTTLIPQGARLIGRYDSDIAFGQSRVQLTWHRLMLPDGSSMQLDNVPASDASGRAGLRDEVDFHDGKLFRGAVLSTLLGVGTELGIGGSESDLVGALRRSTQQNANEAGQQIVKRNLDVKPTIRIRPGWPLRVIVQDDLVLKPWGE